MNGKDKISVIIPCYNVQKYIMRCFDSIYSQTYGFENLEVILIDDLSTDNTWSILESLQRQYPENVISLKIQKKGKCGGARNLGMDICTGKYITFVDADDYVHASWGHEDAIKNDTVKLLDSMGYDSRLVTGDGEAALGFGGSGADVFAENELGDIEKTVEQRFFVDVCVDERDISKCINEQRVILDMRGTMDVFVYVTAISKGVPRISLSADQFLVSGKNGMVIDDFSDIGRSLTYYLDSFENWNQALVECYELGQKYTTSVLLKKWRKVLNFSE